MNKLYFSIVVPAYNESTTIVETLQYLERLSYPKELYEVIVVENGSTDGTWELLQNFNFNGADFKKYQSRKGVSRAKNLGAQNISEKSDWVVFLDADTILESDFLKELNQFLWQQNKKSAVIGTTKVLPYQNVSQKALWWFKVYDWGHKYTQTSYSIQICRSDISKNIRYDETLRLAEDLQFIWDAKKYGKFFFFPTETVFTSTRRFEQTGYVRLFFFWIFFGIMPRRIRSKIDYKVQR